ncbi:hypothetical protein HYS28_00080 [Candidatus Uhrbacteria bacterium]|nr:hypothetical protein [Candidatus Uhrbacteria bacterium]
MVEQRLTIKAAEHQTPGIEGAGDRIATVMLQVPGGKATVFGLFLLRDGREPVRESVARIIRSHLEHAASAMAGDANIPRRFEAALAELNDALHDASQEHGLALDAFESVVGVLTNNQLFVSGIGSLHALFLHKTAERRFAIYELNEQFRADTEATWEKPFVTVLDGELHPGDIFYVANRVPTSAIAVTDLQDVLITLPPQGALERIQQFLPHDLAYGALCFHVAEDDRGGPPKKTNPIASLAHLGQTKSDTQDLLGEQGTDITGIIRRAAAALAAKLSAPGSRGYKSLLKRTARALVQLLAAILIALVALVKLVGRLVRTLLVRILDTQSRNRGTWTTALRRQVDRVRTLPPGARYVGIGIVAIVLVLILSVGIMGRRSAAREEEETFATTVSRIEEKTTAAEASLIYDDTNQARTLLTEAAVLLETLPSDSRNHESEVARLREGIEGILDKVRRIETVTPSLVAELTDGSGLTAFAAADGALYGITTQNQLYRINELEHTVENRNATSGTIGTIGLLASEGSNLLFIDSNQRLGRADVAANTLNPVTSGVDGLAGVDDITVYNDALYVLSADSQQIAKMRPQGGNYEAGTDWISERASDLTLARDIAIDGDLYVLTGTDVVRFKSGREVTWDHEALDPALGDPVDLWTDIDSPYLYMLARNEGGRIIVYDKATGKIVTQYTTPELASAIGFVVREADNQIVFATGSQIWSFSATHLLK